MDNMFIALGKVPKNPALWPVQFWPVAIAGWRQLQADDVAISPQRVCGEDGSGMCLLAAMPVKFEPMEDEVDKFVGLCSLALDVAAAYTKEDFN